MAVARLATKMTLLPEAARAVLRRRLAEAIGLGLMLVALGLGLALLSYTPADPSFSHATGAPVRNLMGRWGAIVADILVQTLGLAAVLLVFFCAAWGWRLFRVHRLKLWWARIALMPLVILLAAMALSMLPVPDGWRRLDTQTGGVVGQIFFAHVLRASARLGLGGEGLAAISGTLAALALVFALAITWGEWRALARVLAWTARMAGRLSFILLRRHRPPDPAELRAQAKQAARCQRIEPSFEAAPRLVCGTPILPQSGLVEPRLDPAARRPRQGRLALESGGRYRLPSLDLLAAPEPAPRGQAVDEAALAHNARLLESVLDDFGVKGHVVRVRPGPVVTLYELEPAPGTKTSRVIGLADDIARSMSAVSVRVAVIPGRNVIGIELPNAARETVYLRELLSIEPEERAGALPLALGRDIGGAPVVVDLARMPHLLIAGTTGSGKSVAINTMVLSLLYRYSPEDCRLVMIDPKLLELSAYDGIPHLLAPVVTDPRQAIVALKWTVREMENRYRAMSKLGVRNIAGYNARLAEAKRNGEVLLRKVQTGFDEAGQPIVEDQPLDLRPLPFIVVVVDEMADLMMVAGKEIEWAVQRLAQMARAAGIHLIMATQRPSVDVITGTIKANFPTRISFQVTSRIDSRTILGEQGAEHLLGQGDMLYMAGGGRITRVHGPFVSEREVEAVVQDLKAQGTPEYLDEVTRDLDEDGPAAGGEGGGADALYDQALAIVTRERKASTSFIQRHLQVGYNRAARIIERMEAEGVVGAANHVGKREVLAPRGAYNG
ncbi:MAG: DNA translocase FtsK [Pseudomonadota bacterium]